LPVPRHRNQLIDLDPNDFSQSMEWPAGFAIAESTETTAQDQIKFVPQDSVEL